MCCAAGAQAAGVIKLAYIDAGAQGGHLILSGPMRA